MSGTSTRRTRALRTWAFAAVPAVGLIELAAHGVQTQSVTPDRDWVAARDYVATQAKSEDLVVFAPAWVDPIGRERFGSTIATIEREARADETRFPRAFEVAIRGSHSRELGGWRPTGKRTFGRVTVTTWENPSPAVVLDDLVSMMNPQQASVSQRGLDCPFVHEGAQSGGLGFGPAVPGQHFACPNTTSVGVSIVANLDYAPHRCIYAPPTAAGALRFRFFGVHFGRTLHGHHGLYVEAERGRQGAPVAIAFSVGNVSLGTIVHRDGEGWKPFELDTAELADKRADLVADISSSGERRLYCFEADTR